MTNNIPTTIEKPTLIPGLVYDVQCKVLTRFPFNQLIQFVQKHPDPTVWNRRYEILFDVYARKESMTLDELTAYRKIFCLNLTGNIKSWTGFANDPENDFSLANLKHLDLSYQNGADSLSDADLIAITTLCPALTSINLHQHALHNKITDLSIQALAVNCPKLTSINLSACYHVTDAAIQSLAEHCQELSSINLSFCNNISDTSIQTLAEHCQKLSSINLSFCDNISDTIIQMLAKRSPLTSIGLRNVPITNVSIEALREHCPHLRSIELGGEVTNDMLQTLARFPNITSIRLDNCYQLRDAEIQTIARGCPNLTSIELWEGQITDAAIQALAEHCPNLTSINLRFVPITNASIQALRTQCTHLSSIELGGVTNDVLQTLAEFPNLTSIHLIGCPLLTDAEFEAIGQGCPNLTSIKLGQCQITGGSLLRLANRCHKLNLIQYFDCRGLRDADIQAIKESHPHIKLERI